ncbi:SWIM zinc finger family protein [Paenibacillus physcomitrellae]|nr:SWIM zinc finger family protein [Paenibacillus physcomitrellae]
MKPDGLIQDAEWNRLVRYTGSQFDEVTLSRGFLYFKQGRVEQLEMPEPALVRAAVRGSDPQPYKVEIPLETLSLASCSCPVNEPCKHMAAALMKLAETQGRSVNSLANAKAKQMLASAKPAAKPAPPLLRDGLFAEGSYSDDPASRRQDQAGRNYADHSDQGSGIARWHALFQRVTAPLEREVRNSAYADKALELILQAKRNLSPAAEQLYGLHAHLFVQQSLLQPVRIPGAAQAYSSHLGYFTHVAVGELDKAVLLSLGDSPAGVQGGEREELKELKPLLIQSLEWLRSEMLKEQRERYYFSHYYYRFWKEWLLPVFPGTELLREELAKLDAEEAASPAGLSDPVSGKSGDAAALQQARVIQPYALDATRAWLLAQLGEDEPAWERLRTAASLPSGLRPENLSNLLDIVQQTGSGARLTSWLMRLVPLLKNSRTNQLESYFAYWEAAAALDPSAGTLMWRTLEELLPAAQRFYERKLFEHGRFREWMDYQLSAGAEPLDFKVKDLQKIEKADPRLLLPFYHQAVERYVTHKNRDSYKKAVKLLKRLAKLYAKLKQTERWERFVTAFTVRYSRLRALQEELRKGKLIS